ncbi:MAG: nitrate/nitrite transporter NrtS [Pseudomonadota bacterium]
MSNQRINKIAARGFLVAIIVGSALNLINQGDAIFGGGAINYWKLALTYAVPFFVSCHGAVSAPTG